MRLRVGHFAQVRTRTAFSDDEERRRRCRASFALTSYLFAVHRLAGSIWLMLNLDFVFGRKPLLETEKAVQCSVSGL